jgi:hypothetical protein
MASARLATAHRVICSPPPAIITGRLRLLHRLRLKDRILDVEIPAVEGRPRVWVADARRFITVYTLFQACALNRSGTLLHPPD